MQFERTKYQLKSYSSGKTFDDQGWMLEAPGETDPTLICAVYENKQITVKDDGYGLYRFAEWLPVSRMLEGSSAPVTYRSRGLAEQLGLSNLWITFSGYWPEKGVEMQTCSFKETEAYPVCARLAPDSERVLVVASAGNTARAFAKVCSDNHIPLLLCVPEDNLNALWFEHPIEDCVKLIASAKGSDYYDAIHLSNVAASVDGFIPEGGAKNVARRDGMGTTVLSAVTTIGRIPDYYFQAVGSGTGAIAAWEANLRLIGDGRFGGNKMKLMVSQNSPFTPIYDAWEKGSREMLPMDDDTARKQVEAIYAKVLSNRKPPYACAGGLYDALTDSRGHVLLATNEEAIAAGQVFKETEGIDIHPAAGVAVASLIEETKKADFPKDAVIMLNITGGGEERFREGKSLHFLKPSLVLDAATPEEEVKRKITALFESPVLG
ncbi:cysteate synthase [Bacteroidota bacterium]